MATKWQVTYELNRAVPVAGNPDCIPDFGVTLRYDAEGKLSSVIHHLETDDNASGETVVEESHSVLQLMWELFEYRRGEAVQIRNVQAQRVSRSEASDPRAVATGYSSLRASGRVVRQIAVPAPRKVTSAPKRLRAWLRFANEAREASTEADALRIYYLILEDMNNGRIAGPASDPKVQVRFMRNFVSHGKVNDQSVRDIVETELGYSADQFDPTRQDHRSMVAKFRDTARTLVESEIDAWL